MCYEIVLLPHTPSARTQAPVANHHTLSPETCLQQFRALALAAVGLLPKKRRRVERSRSTPASSPTGKLLLGWPPHLPPVRIRGHSREIALIFCGTYPTRSAVRSLVTHAGIRPAVRSRGWR